MNKPDYHTNLRPRTATELLALNENGIITRLVATRKNYLVFKRALDIIFSVLFIVVVLSWVLPIIALLIKLGSKGPVFFLQKRIGRDGTYFTCVKFRTMIQNEEADEQPAGENDHRITRTGRFLRRTNIDELPQFFNILAGSMSLVGPRPHMIADCMRFSFVVTSYKFRTLVKPGITGLAQIKGYIGPATDYESIMTRYYWDAVYVRKAGFWLDVKITAITIQQSLCNFIKASSAIFNKKRQAFSRDAN